MFGIKREDVERDGRNLDLFKAILALRKSFRRENLEPPTRFMFATAEDGSRFMDVFLGKVLSPAELGSVGLPYAKPVQIEGAMFMCLSTPTMGAEFVWPVRKLKLETGEVVFR